MIAAVELVRNNESMEPVADDMEDIDRICEGFRDLCLEQGIIVRPIGSTIMMCPPLIITRREIDFLVEKFQSALDEFERII